VENYQLTHIPEVSADGTIVKHAAITDALSSQFQYISAFGNSDGPDNAVRT
jgi:hypothetical protein